VLILFSINLVKLIDRHGSHSCILLVDGGSIRKCLTWRPLINSCTLNCSCMAYAYADLSSAWGTMDWATHRGVRTAWRSPASLELVHPACLISWYARSSTPHLSIPGAGSNICAQCEYVTVIHVICRHRSKPLRPVCEMLVGWRMLQNILESSSNLSNFPRPISSFSTNLQGSLLIFCSSIPNYVYACNLIERNHWYQKHKQ